MLILDMIQKITMVSTDEENKIFISWDPKFALGIGYIDDQHKHLVELCNKLYQEIMVNKNDQNDSWKISVGNTLKECVEYVKYHFSNEEKLMTAIKFDGFAVHKARHNEFTEKVLETARNFNSMTFTDALKLTKFLYNWILSHIAHEDKLYVKPIQEYKKIWAKTNK